MKWTNFHSHTNYCDGSDSPEVFLQQALNSNIAKYGFSGHAPVDFSAEWCIKSNQIVAYLSEIELLRKKYSGQIDVFKGLEIDFFHDLKGRAAALAQKHNLDYFVGSVHFVDSFPDGTRWDIISKSQDFKQGLLLIFGNDGRKFVERYFQLISEMATYEKPDIIGHIDLIQNLNVDGFLFDDESDWYNIATNNALDAILASGSIVEVSTRGLYKKRISGLYPAIPLLKKILVRRIPITLNSDCHQPAEVVSHFEYAVQLLLQLGFNQLQVMSEGAWQGVEFTEKGLYL